MISDSTRLRDHSSSVSLTHQSGVVLIIALIMLVIISLLATYSLRNAASTEMVSGNVRTTELATQVAESTLKYCEDQAYAFAQGITGTITPIPFETPAASRWKHRTGGGTTGELDYWDGSTSTTSPTSWHAITATSVVSATTTFKRPPECMIETVFDPASTDTSINTTTFIITVRGFGPEVAQADASRSRPVGTEVWLQSTVGY
jgi:type IV pilus assembly protein PilX